MATLKEVLVKAAQEKRLKQDGGGLSLDNNSLWTPIKSVRLTLQNAAEYGDLEVEETPQGLRYTRAVSADTIEAIFSAPAAKKTRKSGS